MKINLFPFHIHIHANKEQHNNDHREEESDGGATFHINHKSSHANNDGHCLEETRKSSTPCSISHRHGPEVRSGTKMTQRQPRPQSPSSLRTTRRHLRKGFLNTLDEMVDEQL
eukprot:CAMPEP_0113491902 /NCGR_PEP_ID=MMETSP0014_2-20120614/27797_1 /TAXON_ID=2857 /ORGANISM="Nitzschia sp." /LENGTH=112 /DNA_ID=CAMNT_0000385711 /DNA_START=230 /DNA_END=565 /DNA_ORIENTATION=+ /assembly_acc=CAM_ASM_000159